MTTTTSTQTLASSKKLSFASPIVTATTTAPTRKTMSITQTYFLAHKARAKLSSQAARPDHNLRLLVGHANLLDTLMLELADAEREQESWFNQSVRATQHQQQPPKQPVIVEEPDEDWDAEDTDDDSDDSDDSDSDLYSESDEEEDEEDESSIEEGEPKDVEMTDFEVTASGLYRVASHTDVVVSAKEVDSSTDDEADEDLSALSLTRSLSHHNTGTVNSPPELIVSLQDDSDVSSDDEADMPPSPPVLSLDLFSEKHAAVSTKPSSATSPTSPQQDDSAFDDPQTKTFYLPPRNPARLVSVF